MEGTLTQITNYVLTQSWQIALLVAVIALVNLALRHRSAHVRYLLWLVVLTKCLVPPLLSVPLAVLPEEKSVPASILDRPVAPETAPVVVPSTPVRPALPEQTVASRTVRLHPRQWFALVWMSGVTVFILIAAVKALRTQLWLRRSRKLLPVELQNGIADLFFGLGLKRFPKVWMVEGIGQPFVWGLLRGGIYLPANFLNVNSAAHRRGVLGHELSHVLRFDAAVNLFQVVAQAVFWFHPFVWWANKRIRAEREKCCDEMAIARLNARAKDYSRAIVETLVTEHESTRPIPSLAIAGPVKNIEERIKTMMKPGKRFYKRPSLVAATAVMLIAVLTVPTALVLTARAAEAATQSKAKPPKSLHEAAEAGNLDEVKRYIASGTHIHAKNDRGETALHRAAREGHRDVAEFLIDKGAGVNMKNNRKQTPLHHAARYGHRPVVELLLDHGADLTAKYQNQIAFDLSIQSGDASTVELFLARGADVNAKNQKGRTPLHRVIKGWTNSSILKFLISKGADVNAKDNEGVTVLHDAAGEGMDEIVSLLISKGADVHAKTNEGLSTIDAAILGPPMWTQGNHKKVIEILVANGAQVSSIHQAAYKGDLEKVKEYLKQDVDVNIKGPENRTALHFAARAGQMDVVKLLLAEGAVVNAKAENGVTPLHAAIESGDQTDIAKLLIVRGADVNTQVNMDVNEEGIVGGSPLHIAAILNRIEMAKLLIANGADVNSKSQMTGTPIMGIQPSMALVLGGIIDLELTDESSDDKEVISMFWRRRKALAELFLDHGADVNETMPMIGWRFIHFASAAGLPEAIELLISHGADVNVRNNEGQTSLHIAVSDIPDDIALDRLGTVKLLIAKGADLNARDGKGGTALWYAQKEGHKQIVDLLRKHGAQLAAPVTALRDVAEEGNIEQVRMLIESGADVNTRALKRPFTPLLAAISKDHKEVAELLINHGADINAKGYKEGTALHHVARRGHTGIMKLLLSNGADTEAKSDSGATPLLWAAYYGQTEMAKLLVEHGANIEARMPDGETTPLFHALLQGNTDTVALFLDKGADVRVQKGGWDPLATAMWYDNKEIVTLMGEKRSEFSDVHIAAYFGDLNQVKRYLSDGGHVDAGGPSGFTLLHCAVCGDQKDLAQYLIAKGADVNKTDTPGWPPLQLIGRTGASKEMIELLLDKGADVNQRAKWGHIALHWAAAEGQKPIVEMLLARGSDVNVRTNSIGEEKEEDAAWTPLHRACEWGHKDIAEILIVHGADINAKTTNGKTAISLGKEKKHKQVVELLRQHGAEETFSWVSLLRRAVAKRDVEEVRNLLPPLKGVKAERNKLANRQFMFFHTEGSSKEYEKRLLILRNDGTIDENSHPNESTWQVDEEGRVLIKHKDGRISTVLNEITVQDGKYELRGPFLFKEDINHILREQ